MRTSHSRTARRSRLMGAALCMAAATLLVSGGKAEHEPLKVTYVEPVAVIGPAPELIPIAAVRITLPAPAARSAGQRIVPESDSRERQAHLPIAALGAAPLDVPAPVRLAIRAPVLPVGRDEPAPPPILPDGPGEPRLAVIQPQPPRPDERAFVPQITESVRTAYIAQLDLESGGQKLAVRAGSEVLGAVEFQVADGRVSVHVGQVLDLFETPMGAERFAELRGSSAAREFVALERLQAAGIPLAYDPVYDELVLEPVSG